MWPDHSLSLARPESRQPDRHRHGGLMDENSLVMRGPAASAESLRFQLGGERSLLMGQNGTGLQARPPVRGESHGTQSAWSGQPLGISLDGDHRSSGAAKDVEDVLPSSPSPAYGDEYEMPSLQEPVHRNDGLSSSRPEASEQQNVSFPPAENQALASSAASLGTRARCSRFAAQTKSRKMAEKQTDLLLDVNVALEELVSAAADLASSGNSAPSLQEGVLQEGSAAIVAYERIRARVHARAMEIVEELRNCRSGRRGGRPWHLQRGFFLDLPLAYYNAHSAMFLSTSGTLATAAQTLLTYLEGADREPGPGETVNSLVSRFRGDTAGDLSWLTAGGSSEVVRTKSLWDSSYD